jgi:hypothetical protein
MNQAFDPRTAAIADGVTSEPFNSRMAPGAVQRHTIEARPLIWRDPSAIPRRQWLYPRTFVRKFVTATIAPGGVGKTGLGLVELLAMATGRDLLDDGFEGEPLRVWYWNGEDPLEEMERQVHAALIHYKIKQEDLGDRFFLNSGRDMPIKVVVSDRIGFTVDTDCLHQIIATIKKNRIDVAIFDPLVSIHSVPENSNEAKDAVVKALAQVANETNCAIGIVAHTRKQQAGANSALSADDARGGKALVDAARVVRVLNRMTPAEGGMAGVVGNAARRYFWIGSDKINLTPPDAEKPWRYLESVHLPNGETEFEGDNMRVVTAWQWPDPFSDISVADLLRFQEALDREKVGNRQSIQSPEWAGHLLAELLRLDTAPKLSTADCSPEQKQARDKCKVILGQWQKSGALALGEAHDKKRGRKYQILTVGEWAR